LQNCGKHDLVFEALRNGDLPEFRGYAAVKAEYRYGNAKFDFFLSNGVGLKPCLLEVKSCTLVRDGVAMFPDAPTERGARHVLELAKALDDGYKAAVLFVIQRDDAHMFKPNDDLDPKFGRALRGCKGGVEVYAYTASFTGNRLCLAVKLELCFSHVKFRLLEREIIKMGLYEKHLTQN
jgi:sugar fermentation stimulation protein A